MGIGSRIRNQLQQAQQQPQQPQQQGTPQSAFPQPMGGKGGGVVQRIQQAQQPVMHRQTPLQQPPAPMGGKGGGASNITRQMPIDRTQQPPAQMGGKGAIQSFQDTLQGQQQSMPQVQPMQQDQAAALTKQQIMQGGQFTPDPTTIFPRQQPLQQVQYPNQMPQGLAALLQNQQTGGM